MAWRWHSSSLPESGSLTAESFGKAHLSIPSNSQSPRETGSATASIFLASFLLLAFTAALLCYALARKIHQRFTCQKPHVAMAKPSVEARMKTGACLSPDWQRRPENARVSRFFTRAAGSERARHVRAAGINSRPRGGLERVTAAAHEYAGANASRNVRRPSAVVA